MDEQTMFRSAFATASTVGATVKRLVEYIGIYKGVLDKENDSFQKTLNAQVAEKISGMENKVKQLEKEIQEKSLQLRKITDEIDQHQKEILKTKEVIEVDKTKIESTRKDFTFTYNKLMEQIDNDLKKINQYLS